MKIENAYENGRRKALNAIQNSMKLQNWNRKDISRKKLFQLIKDGVVEVMQGDARKDRDIHAEMTNNRREVDFHIMD